MVCAYENRHSRCFVGLFSVFLLPVVLTWRVCVRLLLIGHQLISYRIKLDTVLEAREVSSLNFSSIFYNKAIIYNSSITFNKAAYNSVIRISLFRCRENRNINIPGKASKWKCIWNYRTRDKWSFVGVLLFLVFGFAILWRNEKITKKSYESLNC